MKHLDLGSTYQFGGMEPKLTDDTLVEVNNDGTFCYNDVDAMWGPEIAGALQVLGDYVEGLPFPDNYFDLAAGSCFLEYREPMMLKAFKEVFRVLKPGGFLKVKGCSPASRRYYDDAVAAGFEIWSPAAIYWDESDGWSYDTPYYFMKPNTGPLGMAA